MKRTLWLSVATLLTLLLTNGAMARQLTPEEALNNARKANAGELRKVRALESREMRLAYTARENDNNCYYVFNNGDNEGFVILSADDLAPAVLGYSENGTFDYDKIPENMKWWLSQYKKNIGVAVKSGQAIRRTETVRAEIPALVQTQWDQSAPYNNMCPTISGTPTYTGCVATAMAQLMYYHKWPVTGTGYHEYTSEKEGLYLSANFGSTVYKWSDMALTYSEGYYTTTQADAVAELMYHCGVSVDMDYGTDESGANIRDVPVALTTYFGYDKAMLYKQRFMYTDSEWETLVYNELAADRPVLYNGRTTNSGHAFICDGYKGDGYFHINWGWGGYCDGHYLMTGTGALQPDGSGIGGGTVGEGYTNEQGCVVGIQKPQEGSEAEMVMGCPDGYTITAAAEPITRSTTLTFNGRFENMGITPVDVTIGIMFKNTATDDVYYKSYTTTTLYPNYGWSSFTFNADCVMKNGEYEVYPVYKAADEEGEWKMAQIRSDVEIPRITVTGDLPAIYISKKLCAPNNNNATLDNVELRFSVTANEDFDEQILAWVFPYNGGQSIDHISTALTMKAGETRDIVLRGDMSGKIEADHIYSIILYTFSGVQITPNDLGTMELTVVDKAEISYTMTSAGWGTLILPFEAEVPAGLTAYCCSATDGDKLVLTPAESIEMNTPYILAGTSGTYDFAGPKTTDAGKFTRGYLTGTLEGSDAPDGSYVLQNNPQHGVAFYKVSGEGIKVNANRAYLTVPGTATSALVLPDAPTGIDGVYSVTPENTDVYSITGVLLRKGISAGDALNTLPGGIYIVNGKKVIKK